MVCAAHCLAMLFIPLTGWLAFTEHVSQSLGVRPAGWFGFCTLLLVILRALEAVKHHFFEGDRTLMRGSK